MVRARVVAQLAAHPELYAHFVGQPYHQYVDAMARSGTWGDHVTLKAAGAAPAGGEGGRFRWGRRG
jgi:hypothetical protein